MKTQDEIRTVRMQFAKHAPPVPESFNPPVPNHLKIERPEGFTQLTSKQKQVIWDKENEADRQYLVYRAALWAFEYGKTLEQLF